MSTADTQSVAIPLPATLEAIDAAWLTQALRTQAPGVTVRDFQFAETIRGTCTKVRIRLDMDAAARAAGIPETLFLKGGFEEHSRDFAWLMMTEALGYRDLLVGGELNNPRCYFAQWDADTQRGIVLMEDLARRDAEFGDPLKPRSHDDIAQTLTLMARYHARTWGFPDCAGAERLGWVETAPPFTRPSMKPYLEPDAWARYTAMPRGAAVSQRFRNREWALAALESMAALCETVPNCVIHGDSHLGNVYFTPDGGAGFYDTVPRRAPPLSEVCYHVTLALDLADRPRWDRDLVRHYLAELKACGVADAPDIEEAMRQFGAFLIEGYCLVLTNDAYFMPETPITAYAARFSQAMLDHDTAGQLSVTE